MYLYQLAFKLSLVIFVNLFSSFRASLSDGSRLISYAHLVVIDFINAAIEVAKKRDDATRVSY